MDPSNNINPSAARTYFVEPQHEEAGQANFDQQLGQIEPIYRKSAPLEAGSSGIVTEGNKRARLSKLAKGARPNPLSERALN